MTFAEALGELGLETGASREAIRAAYLKLLRVRRPDSDPEGFQRLREAYERVQAIEAAPDQSAAPAVVPVEHAWMRELLRIGDDPLRTFQRIRVLDAAFAAARDDEELAMALLEEIVSAGLVDRVAGVLAAHRPSRSTRPWEWALRNVPPLESETLRVAAHGADPVLKLRVALLFKTVRGEDAVARSLSAEVLRALLKARPDEALAQVDRLRDSLPLAVWLLSCLLLIDADVTSELSKLTDLEATLLGTALRAHASAGWEILAARLPSAAAAELPGDPREEPYVRFLQLQLNDPVERAAALAELGRRRPSDVDFTKHVVEQLFADGKFREVVAQLAVHAGALSRYQRASSPVWQWAVLQSAALMKLTESAPESSPVWMRVMMAWSLAASGGDADVAAGVLVEVVTSVPESELLAGRQVLLVAMLEVCARSMASDRAVLMNWLARFVREDDFEFAVAHDNPVLERTLHVVVTRLRAILLETNFAHRAEIDALARQELLSLRERVRAVNPRLEARAARLSLRLPSSVDELFERVFWLLVFSAGGLAVAGVAWALVRWLGA